MEFTFTPIRIGIFICLLAVFWFFDGFTHPAIRLDLGDEAPRYLLTTWGLCMALFITGASSATLVEHWAGNIDPTNLQAFYITIGIILMAIALFWNHAIGTNPIIG